MSEALLGLGNLLLLSLLTLAVIIHAQETDRNPVVWGGLTLLFHIVGFALYVLVCVFDGK